MCGIAGFFTTRRDVPESRLRAATDAMTHRGPDDSGTQIISFDDGQVGLGNRRLAIVDLSAAGHQPMRDERTGNWITHNGEVYNFGELRTELEQRGHRFHSHTDTEVLLKSYGERGCAAIHQWRGMFACAFWDQARRRLVLVRDRLGIKPLYYSVRGGELVFASEVRALLRSAMVEKRLCRAAVLSYLLSGAVDDPLTIVEGVHSLPPGHYLEFDGKEVQLHRYWNLPEQSAAQEKLMSYQDLVEQTRALLEESVRLRLISDVPIGAFLSGGIDSSSIVALMSRAAASVKTFSIVFSEPKYNEAEHSREVARKFGTEHHELLVTEQDVLRELPDALAAMDQPTIDGVNTYFVSQATRGAGVTAALSGLGGDEVFAGYGTFRYVPRMEQYERWLAHLPSAARRILGAAVAGGGRNDRWRKAGYLISGNGAALDSYLLARCLFTPAQAQRLLGPQADAALPVEATQYRDDLLVHAGHHDSVNRVSCLELRTYMANTLLRDTDVMSMAHSLEVRVPFIDHKLVEHVLRIPGELKLHARTPKRLLVDAMHGELPDSIVYRPKWGFGFPFVRWLHNELRPTVEAAVQGNGLGDVLRPEEVRNQWQAFLAGRTSWSRPWALFVLNRWCELNLAGVQSSTTAGAAS